VNLAADEWVTRSKPKHITIATAHHCFHAAVAGKAGMRIKLGRITEVGNGDAGPYTLILGALVVALELATFLLQRWLR
jgi:hypothetical protein